MKKHASKCLLVIRCANFDVQHSMPDSPRPKYAKSSPFALSEIQKLPGKNGEIHFITVLSLFARQWHVFHHQISCFPGAAPVIIKYYVTETSSKVSENEPLTTVLPCQKGTLRVKGWSSVSQRGFFLPHTTTPCLPRTSAR